MISEASVEGCSKSRLVPDQVVDMVSADAGACGAAAFEDLLRNEPGAFQLKIFEKLYRQMRNLWHMPYLCSIRLQQVEVRSVNGVVGTLKPENFQRQGIEIIDSIRKHTLS